ncbi:MAG: hypothetical protein ACI4S0_12485 [Dorea sp.]
MYKQNIFRGKTVDIFDYFREQKDSMLIENFLIIDAHNYRCYINLIFEHCDWNIKSYNSKIVISELKKCFGRTFIDVLDGRTLDEVAPIDVPSMSLPAYQFLLYLKNSLEKEIENAEEKKIDDIEYALKDKIVTLDIPVRINAKTTANTDYSWGGNKYGDTSNFYITRYKINQLWEGATIY